MYFRRCVYSTVIHIRGLYKIRVHLYRCSWPGWITLIGAYPTRADAWKLLEEPTIADADWVRCRVMGNGNDHCRLYLWAQFGTRLTYATVQTHPPNCLQGSSRTTSSILDNTNVLSEKKRNCYRRKIPLFADAPRTIPK